MLDFSPVATDLAWPFALAIAWVVGELGHRWTGLPRISIYGLVGFLLANSQMGFLSPSNSGFALLAYIAFGLILFELGYRINLRWLRTNPWIAASGVVEALATFGMVFLVARWFDTPPMASLLLASLAMSTSPAGILRVVNEQASSGQVTERVLLLSALNCVLAVFAFKLIVGVGVFQTSGNFLDAAWSGLAVVLVSVALGALFGVAMPALMRQLGNLGRDATLGFAIGVILLVALTHTFRFSPVLAALTFGLVARHRRVVLSPTQRNFGVMGDLLTVLLFFYVATTLQWASVVEGMALGLILIGVRFLTKTLGVAAFSRATGISWRKGLLTGMALTPISVFVILLLEQTRHLGITMVEGLVPLAAIALLLEVLGPVVTQRALIWARETPDAETKES
jgi:Kef-type K+ transport system membrane component KefB